ncbi:MAG: hypothetical protein U0174_16825 [Polyangiaceae bacterium]
MNIRSTLALVLLPAAFACGGKSDPPPNGVNTSGGMASGGMASGGMASGGMSSGGIPGADNTSGGTASGGVPAGTSGGTTPTTPPAAGGQGGTAQAVDPSIAAGASMALQGLANTEAAGAAKEGNPVAGNFQQGQTIEQTFTMQPGKCYTVVASSIGIQQLDITASLITPIPGMAAQFGQATGKPGMTGSQAVLGSKANCLKLALIPMAVQAKFTITASKGGGLAVAQLYAK